MSVAIIVAVAGMFVYSTQSKKLHLSCITMENVEALAHDESYSEKIFYQNSDPCKTWDGGYNEVTFYCSIGIESYFSNSCISGSCGDVR